MVQVVFFGYLAWQLKETIKGFKVEGNVILPATWKSGFLISGVTLRAQVCSAVLLILVFTSGK